METELIYNRSTVVFMNAGESIVCPSTVSCVFLPLASVCEIGKLYYITGFRGLYVLPTDGETLDKNCVYTMSLPSTTFFTDGKQWFSETNDTLLLRNYLLREAMASVP